MAIIASQSRQPSLVDIRGRFVPSWWVLSAILACLPVLLESICQLIDFLLPDDSVERPTGFRPNPVQFHDLLIGSNSQVGLIKAKPNIRGGGCKESCYKNIHC